jgi:hypothetical protein
MRKMNRRIAAFALPALLAAILAAGMPVFAQSASSTSAPAQPSLRFFQQFITDAEIVDKQWWSAEMRWQGGAVPPFENADGFLLTPMIAISPVKNLEVGGKISYIKYDLNHDFNGTSGASGLGDLTLYGKYRFLRKGAFDVTAGASFDLPTGSETDGLGTGKFVATFFGAMRMKVGGGSFLGEAGFRFNPDATVINTNISGKTSTFLGGGYIWEPARSLAVSGELTVESERYDGASSDFRLTGGVQWLGLSHSVLRAALSAGLSDGAPDYEIILGYAYTF